MNSLSSSSPSVSLSSITLLLQPHLRSRLSYHHRRSLLHPNKYLSQRKKRSLRCRADLSQDAPFALAIGSCVLNSLIFPVASDGDDGDADGGSGINSTDTRFAVMGIISFVPYFNWLSWIFAWLDTGRQRYLVYSIVYLAPYLRTNLSLSPEESWLPLSSIIFCIAHIQLEASIRSGDIKTNELFGEALKFLSPVKRQKDAHMQSHQGFEKDEKKKERMNLHSAQEESRDKIRGLGVPRKPLDDDAQRQTDDQENDYERKD
ncbi:hypothetical protein AAC387_Pa01g3374 [Persea americana]